MSTPQPPASSWHLDKNVPITIILTLLLQSAGGLWFVSKLDSRIEFLERDRAKQHDVDAAQDARLAETVRTIREDVRDMNSKIDRLIEYQARRGKESPP